MAPYKHYSWPADKLRRRWTRPGNLMIDHIISKIVVVEKPIQERAIVP